MAHPIDTSTVVVVVVDSHIQRIVLATEETTVTQQVSHRPIKCQSRLWSQSIGRLWHILLIPLLYRHVLAHPIITSIVWAD